MCKEGTCKCKEICAKMQEAGLRRLLLELRNYRAFTKRNDVYVQLSNMLNIFETYKCLPLECLKSRLAYIKRHFMYARSEQCITTAELGLITEFIDEVEAFLDNQNA